MAKKPDLKKNQGYPIIDLRSVLEKKDLDKTGIKEILLEKVQKGLLEAGQDPEKYSFILSGREKTQTPRSKIEEKVNEKGEKEDAENDIDNTDIILADETSITESVQTELDPSSKETGSDIHKCAYCGREFRQKRYHYAHLREVHKINAKGKPVSAKVAKRVFDCVLCNRKFTRKGTMQRHIVAVHPDESSELFKCEKCEFTTKRKDNLTRHIEKCHQSCADGTVQPNFQCSYCSGNFKLKSSLSRHENKHHNRKKPSKPTKTTKTKRTLVYKRKCPLCPFDNPDYKLQSMYTHFENVHKIYLQWEHHYFDTLDEFYEWKSQLEKLERSSFVMRSKSKSTILFNCRRCGVFKPAGKNRRHRKITGTCKINGFCPSFIKIKIKNGLVMTLYQRIHVGHDRELEYVRLSNEDKKFLATKLAENVPHAEILQDIRGSLAHSEVQRIHLIGRKDLINMKRRLKQNKEEKTEQTEQEICHPDDPVSNKSWVDPTEKCQVYEEKAWLVYEEKGPSGPSIEQYCRVCGLEMPTENLIPIFGEEGCELLLEKKILDHIHLQVKQDDQLPQQVCLACASHLNTCQQFMEASHAAAYKLHQLFLPNEAITENKLNEANTVVEIWEGLPQEISNNGETKENENMEVTGATIIEENTQTFTCKVCDTIFTRRKFLEAHTKREHDSWFKCEDCGKMLQSRKSLNYHRRSQHSGELPYQCSYCVRGFLEPNQLEAHEAKHTNQLNYKCDTCGESFGTRNYLNKHTQRKHGKTNLLECEFCGKLFQRKGALNIHRRLHSGENLHVCNICGRGFTRSSYLFKHQKTHEDGSTHICNLCLFMFSSKKELTKHEQEAHGEQNNIPLIVTNNVYETHVITEDGQQIIFPAVSMAFEESEIVISDVPDTIVTHN